MTEQDDSFNATRAELFEALGHPMRVRILRSLDGRSLGFAELKRETGLESGGHLQFHLGKLHHLVQTNAQGSYVLTDDGKEAILVLKSTGSDETTPRGNGGTRMRNWKNAVLAGLVIATIVLAGVAAYEQELNGNQAGVISNLQNQVSLLQSNIPRLTKWVPYASYPADISVPSCTGSSSYIYCIGGYNRTAGPSDSALTDSVYSSSSAANGTWVRSTNYPIDIAFQSCVTYSDHIYCIGGFDGVNGTSVFYASLLSNGGISSWIGTSRYPVGVNNPSCSVSLGYIYCVRGWNENGADFYVVNATYYAPISSSGIGTWRSTVSPPGRSGGPCVSASGYIYCVGGEYYDFGHHNVPTNATYYAPISSSGIGTWSRTTDYPTAEGEQSCVIAFGAVYCVSGWFTTASYYAPISSSGVGPWSRISDYPGNHTGDSPGLTSCELSGSSIHCVGAFGGAWTLSV